ncbi:MAG: DUF6320 domain-containing protein [Bacteroidales bacterium]|jgi:hypothetical protein
MSYCTNCGVELDEGLSSCPLCGFTVGKAIITETRDQSEHYPSDIILLHKRETRKHIWELSGIISFSGIVVCTIVDLVIRKSLSWSLFADTSILASWICLTLILLAFRKYFLIIPGLLITLLTMLLLFNLFSPPFKWFFGIGLPITIAFFVAVSIIILLWKVANFRGFNILAIAFIVLSGFCIVAEVFIDKYLSDVVDIRWSAIVAVSVLPIALVLLFVHYRMKKGKRLDSYFHV